jgi:hypothetical protein
MKRFHIMARQPSKLVIIFFMFFYRYGRIDLPYCQNSFQTHLLSIAGNGVQANLKAIFKQFYKEELSAAQEQNEMLTKIVGKMTVEKEWLKKKLKSLGLSDKKQLIEPKLDRIKGHPTRRQVIWRQYSDPLLGRNEVTRTNRGAEGIATFPGFSAVERLD